MIIIYIAIKAIWRGIPKFRIVQTLNIDLNICGTVFYIFTLNSSFNLITTVRWIPLIALFTM